VKGTPPLFRCVRTFRRWRRGETVVVPYSWYVAYNLPWIAAWIALVALHVVVALDRYWYLSERIPGSDFIEHRDFVLAIVLPFSFLAGMLSIWVYKIVRRSPHQPSPATHWYLASALFFAPIASMDALILAERKAAGFSDCADLVIDAVPPIRAYGTSAAACLQGRDRTEGPD